MHRFLARSLRGIEWIAAAEIEHALSGGIVSTDHREIRFTTQSLPSAASLSRLRTPDDVFMVVGDVSGLDRARSSLATIRHGARSLDWPQSLNHLRDLRPSSKWTAFTVTASFLGKRNYNRYEIEDEVGASVSAATLLRYRSTRESPSSEELTVRVHLVDERASFGIRVFDAPLHRRHYKVRSHTGTLHPPLAAAMSLLVGLKPSTRVLDPFAGVGTIPIETSFIEPAASTLGIDFDGERLCDARLNAIAAKAVGGDRYLVVADAGRLPLRAGCIDRIVTNPPWDIAVEARGSFAAYAAHCRYAELARVLRPDGRVVLLAPHGVAPELAPFASSGFGVALSFQVSVFGQYPWLCVLTPAQIGVPSSPIDRDGVLGEALAKNLRRLEPIPRPTEPAASK